MVRTPGSICQPAVWPQSGDFTSRACFSACEALVCGVRWALRLLGRQTSLLAMPAGPLRTKGGDRGTHWTPQ